MSSSSPGVVWHEGATREQRAQALGLAGATVWLTGLSGSGKSTIAVALEEHLLALGRPCYRLDGDNLRHGLNADLGFAEADRTENVRRVGEVARLFADAGIVALAPVISPYAAGRAAVRAAHERDGLAFVEVYVDTPLDVCESRDPKGLYAKAREGTLTGMTGIDAPYEAPTAPDVHLSGDVTVEEAVRSIAALLPGAPQ